MCMDGSVRVRERCRIRCGIAIRTEEGRGLRCSALTIESVEVARTSARMPGKRGGLLIDHCPDTGPESLFELLRCLPDDVIEVPSIEVHFVDVAIPDGANNR